ncbi:TrmH family RNA methyltransferase [Holospora curviuscula]|uniref:Putative TrmH family tRNA/rRNA methyltransferase n=1 Tax=Holospora curviuscula TaxID=1082868 RepID=A0A2S5R840_9PROT|nr:RNA methyltransferase [Holospora curviuscula]PPE03501.1 putative TrmH family tRNA/rRNA methyltransferase [Holospora curviuscula]
MSTRENLKKKEIWIWGLHSVEAALKAKRPVYELLCIPSRAERFKCFGGRSCSISHIERVVPRDAVHQGVALRTNPSPCVILEDLNPKRGPVLVLDQVVDPYNVGALWRSAAAFQAQAIIFLTQRSVQPGHLKHEGVVAKAASGALEQVPYVSVVNLSRALEELKRLGFFCVGLCETGELLDPNQIFQGLGVALVVGQEGKGLRLLTRQQCDILWKLRVCPEFSTLNVSVAGAIALSQLYGVLR